MRQMQENRQFLFAIYMCKMQQRGFCWLLKRELGWSPRITFKELVKIMVDSDMELVGLDSTGEGKKILKQKGIGWTENHLTVG